MIVNVPPAAELISYVHKETNEVPTIGSTESLVPTSAKVLVPSATLAIVAQLETVAISVHDTEAQNAIQTNT